MDIVISTEATSQPINLPTSTQTLEHEEDGLIYVIESNIVEL